MNERIDKLISLIMLKEQQNDEKIRKLEERLKIYEEILFLFVKKDL